MTRAKNIVRFVSALATLWMVAAAEWPVDDVLGILGGMPCC